MSRAKNLANLIGGASAGTAGLVLPSGTTAQRPGTPQNGTIRYNSTTNSFEAYLGGFWTTVKSSSYAAQILVIAGGGAGGTGFGGGGGAGGYIYNPAFTITKDTTYTVTVGAGGTQTITDYSAIGPSGSNSQFDTLIATGGGGGGSYNTTTVFNASNGGSGGGAGGSGTLTSNYGSAAVGQGYRGTVGFGSSLSDALGGGGGGAGGLGTAAVTGVAGSGGIGIINPISGSTMGQLVSSNYYLAGGGGGGGTTGTAGAGGSGGGGPGQIRASSNVLGTTLNFNSWNYSLGSVATSNEIAPDGSATANLMNTGTPASGNWSLYRTATGLGSGTTWYFSCWVKLGTATNFCVVMNNTTAWNSVSGNKAYTSADGLNTSTWTKIVHPFVVPGTGNVNIHLLVHSESITQQTGGTVYMWAPVLYPSTTTLAQATSGSPNTGSGGGGSGALYANQGGNGGSGLVIVSYQGAPAGIGGNITQVGGYTLHTFTSSGTFVG